jgi:hypothetical protein
MEKQRIVVCVRPDHPSRQYIVAGYKITPTFQMVEDKPEVIKQLEDDAYLVKAPHGSRAWCEACGIEFCERELAKLGLDVHGQPLPKPQEKPDLKPNAAEKEGTQTGTAGTPASAAETTQSGTAGTPGKSGTASLDDKAGPAWLPSGLKVTDTAKK